MASLDDAFGGLSAGGSSRDSWLASVGAAYEMELTSRKQGDGLPRVNASDLRKEVVDVGRVVSQYGCLQAELEVRRRASEALDAQVARVVSMEQDLLRNQAEFVAMVFDATMPDDIVAARLAIDRHYKNAAAEWLAAAGERSRIAHLETEVIADEAAVMRAAILMGAREMVKPESLEKKMCPICFDAEVDMCYVPCGHTVCSACSVKVGKMKCATCRSSVREVVRMFFSV